MVQIEEAAGGHGATQIEEWDARGLGLDGEPCRDLRRVRRHLGAHLRVALEERILGQQYPDGPRPRRPHMCRRPTKRLQLERVGGKPAPAPAQARQVVGAAQLHDVAQEILGSLAALEAGAQREELRRALSPVGKREDLFRRVPRLEEGPRCPHLVGREQEIAEQRAVAIESPAGPYPAVEARLHVGRGHETISNSNVQELRHRHLACAFERRPDVGRGDAEHREPGMEGADVTRDDLSIGRRGGEHADGDGTSIGRRAGVRERALERSQRPDGGLHLRVPEQQHARGTGRQAAESAHQLAQLVVDAGEQAGRARGGKEELEDVDARDRRVERCEQHDCAGERREPRAHAHQKPW